MRRFLAVLIGIGLLAACNNSTAPASAPTAVKPTTAPLAQATSVPSASAAGAILFQDDFSNKNGDWDQQSSTDGGSNYGSGFYSIQVKSANYSIWANPNAQPAFGDVAIDVDAAIANGPEDAGFGPICRYVDTDNFMHATITADGYYGIVLVKAKQVTVLTGQGNLVKSTAINTGKTNNHIQFVCKGNEYTLFVNGQKLESANDSNFTQGAVGLIATTFATGGVEVRFNKYVVTTP
jgi:hypothetical protein